VPVALHPVERIPPVGQAAHGGAFLFYVVNGQRIFDEHHLGPGQAAQAQHPLGILVLQLAALEGLRLHQRATDKQGRCLDVSLAAGQRAARQQVFANLLIVAGMRRGHT
jgi:hypothetical protein